MRVLTEFNEALARKQILLWEIQQREYPGSRHLTVPEVIQRWVTDAKVDQRTMALNAMVTCLQYPGGMFYETKQGYRGYRYGVKGHEYISGFGMY